MAVIKVKLDELLEKRGLSRYRLAEEVRGGGELGSSTVYALVRGEFYPRLETLAVLMSLIERLTGRPVELSDVLEYDRDGTPPEPKQHDPGTGRPATRTKWEAEQEARKARKQEE